MTTSCPVITTSNYPSSFGLFANVLHLTVPLNCSLAEIFYLGVEGMRIVSTYSFLGFIAGKTVDYLENVGDEDDYSSFLR